MRALIISLVCGVCVVSSSPLWAQDKPDAGSSVQSGDITIEDPSHPVLSRDERGEKEAREWLSALRGRLAAPASGKSAELGDSGVSYMASLYFFCSVRAGDCPFMLDKIIAGDVLIGQADGGAGCLASSCWTCS